MTRKEIEDIVKDFLVEELEIDEEKIVPEARLKEDLGIDSLEVVDIAAFVDETFGFKMNVADFKMMDTLGAFCSAVEQKMK